ncbi:MAG: signal protein [Myxococcales bacterium]|nr:signal protein [Myxococcales bacterium]
MEQVLDSQAPARSGRRTYLVDRPFQVKYTLLLAAIGAAVSGLIGSLSYLAHAELARELESAFARSGAAVPEEVKLQLSAAGATVLYLAAGAAVLSAILLGLFGVLLTHRVAGPVWVMSRYVAALAKGRYPAMRPLRRTDELRDLFDGFRGAVETVRQREVEEADQLERALSALGPLSGNPDADQAMAALRAMRDRKRAATDQG